MREHDNEPIWGLPDRLPAGEHLLWQGAPNARLLARRAFHVRSIAVYFAILIAWCAGSTIMQSHAVAPALLPVGRLLGLALAAIALIEVGAWLVARTTVYTITNRRVVIRCGIALPMTINIPFRLVQSAAINVNAAGAGDVVLTLTAEQRIAYAALWPHARPWRFRHTEPMLRALPQAVQAAEILGRALAASAPGEASVQRANSAPGRGMVRPPQPAAA